MMRAVVAVLLMVAAVGTALPMTPEPNHKGDLWAVLVAGSNTWMNYRHQADVCHAYQILHKHGVPDDHIIVMMYDDLAHNPDNPTPGVVINRPNGSNVYEGVPKDYTGKDVTPQNFLKVLSGDSEGLRGVGSGKVLKSGPNDRVFINLVDHGAPGIFGFPTSFLHVKDFLGAIQDMHHNKQFREMVVYMEACESGSMFSSLPDDINVYALSASNATQSSYACYYDSTLNTFLGDVFSVKWMEDTDREDVKKETLKKQFGIVAKETTTSQVEQWGELSLDKMKVSQIVGAKEATHSTYGPFDNIADPCLDTSVINPDVPIAAILRKLADATDTIGQDFWRGQLNEVAKNRTLVSRKMVEIVQLVTGEEASSDNIMENKHHHINNFQCHKEATTAWHNTCFDLAKNPYAMRMVHAIVNLCEHGFSSAQFAAAARTVCINNRVAGIQ